MFQLILYGHQKLFLQMILAHECYFLSLVINSYSNMFRVKAYEKIKKLLNSIEICYQANKLFKKIGNLFLTVLKKKFTKYFSLSLKKNLCYLIAL